MLKLRAKLLETLSEFEADLVLLHAFRREFPKYHSLNELRLQNPSATPEVESEALRITEARTQGTPLQHLLGYQFFFEHEYLVNDSTLIPRPETEVLVKEAIEWIQKKHGDRPFQAIELGLGSGAISGEILAKFKKASIRASEANPLAIALARQNLENILGSSFDQHIQIYEPETESTGFELFLDYGPVDLILSNPPYLSVNDEIQLEVIQHEPHLALFPKPKDGDRESPNYFYENFLYYSKDLLKADGVAFFEVPHDRALAIQHSFENAGLKTTRLIPDLTGRHRVLQAGF